DPRQSSLESRWYHTPSRTLHQHPRRRQRSGSACPILLVSNNASKKPSRKPLRSGHYKKSRKSKRSKNGGTRKVAEHKRRRRDGNKKMLEKKITRHQKGVDEDEVARLRAPVKRSRTPDRAAQAEPRAAWLLAQTLTIGGPAEGEVEVELEVVVAEEGKDVAISLRLH
ncbi:unnamed protein product, partial [Fusarium graminearum]